MSINNQVHELRELKRMREELDVEITKIEDAIKASMEQQEVEELHGTDWTVTYKTVSTTRLDTKKLKAALADVYAAYAYTTTSRRFIVK